jgi:transcription elongation GreA/GreB family factor
MSQAFRKEGDAPEELNERPVPEGPNYVTPSGLKALEAAAAALVKRRGQAGADEKKAIDRDLRYYEARLSSAIVVDNAKNPPKDVRFGARVETSDRTFRIVGQDEADPERELISWSSPLAMSLLGAKPGDVVDGVKVLAVSY